MGGCSLELYPCILHRKNKLSSQLSIITNMVFHTIIKIAGVICRPVINTSHRHNHETSISGHYHHYHESLSSSSLLVINIVIYIIFIITTISHHLHYQS